MSANLLRTPYVPPARPLLVTGNGGLPKLLLRAVDGASAEVYLHGAQVVSWRPSGGGEQLFLSEQACFSEDAAIRGGIPVIFPQFGSRGRLPCHGFAHRLEWALTQARTTADGSATVRLQLSDSRASWALWRHRFTAELTVTVGQRRLLMTLCVRNDGKKRFRFTAALHNYLALQDLSGTRVDGLEGVPYLERASEVARCQAEQSLAFLSAMDRIYPDAPRVLQLREPGRSLSVLSQGFADAVIWNPGPPGKDYPPDLGADEFRRFVCIEPAMAVTPVWLEPGQTWTGRQVLTA